MVQFENLPQLRAAHQEPSALLAHPLSFPDHTNDSAIEFRRYLSVLIKYRFLMAAIIALVTFGATLFAVTATRKYTASSKMRISTYEPVLTATKIEDLLQQKSKETNYLETQVEELRSFSLADRILGDPVIRESLQTEAELSAAPAEQPAPQEGMEDAEYQHPISLIRRYLANVEIRPIRRTSLVTIQATAERPEIAALMANRHAQEYREWGRSIRIEQQARGLAFLKAQSEELGQKVSELEREMADYAEVNSIVAVNKDENITAQKMSQLNKLLTDATSKRIEAEKLYQQAESALAQRAAVLDDNSLNAMRAELSRLEAEFGQLSQKFTPQYPRVQQLASQIASLKAGIQNQRKDVVAGLKAKYLAAVDEETSLKEELEQQTSKAFELSKRQVYYNTLDREATTARDLLQNVLRQIKETSLAVESNSSNVSVVDFAVPPDRPSYPRRGLIVGGGLLAGVIFAICVAFCLNYLDDTLRTPEQVTSLLQLPVLGVVPSFDLEQREEQRNGRRSLPEPGADDGEDRTEYPEQHLPVAKDELLPIAFLTNPQPLSAEAYRTIRTGILLSQAGKPPRTILVSSAQSSEGKTTSSVNLAAALAGAGGRVVLIDCDLRRPSVGKHLRVPRNQPGIVELLTGMRSIDEVAIEGLMPRVTVIPAGTIPPNPAELLGSLEMANLIDRLAQHFDYVIIDSPPVLPVTDSVILARYVDGVMLVIKGGSTPRKVVADAKRRLASVGARFLGAILNDIDVRSGDYYYYNRYYYSYYSDGSTTPKRRRSKPSREDNDLDVVGA